MHASCNGVSFRKSRANHCFHARFPTRKGNVRCPTMHGRAGLWFFITANPNTNSNGVQACGSSSRRTLTLTLTACRPVVLHHDLRRGGGADNVGYRTAWAQRGGARPGDVQRRLRGLSSRCPVRPCSVAHRRFKPHKSRTSTGLTIQTPQESY